MLHHIWENLPAYITAGFILWIVVFVADGLMR